MPQVSVQFLGSGDAFASGARLQTCILVEGLSFRFLIDCGASSLIALKRLHISTAEIDAVIISHLHGDHFGGIPFLLLDAVQVSKRTKPLFIAGPPGLENRIFTAQDALFPGTSSKHPGFDVTFIELEKNESKKIGEIIVTPFEVDHPSGSPSYALRTEFKGKVISYSGDTGWTGSLIHAAEDADLFICESNNYDTKTKHHIDYKTLAEKRGELGCKRLILTHMGEEMLANLSRVDIECAEDGKRMVL